MRDYNSNTQNLLFRVSANPQAILGEVRQGPSSVAPDSGDPAFVCDYIYCKAGVDLDPGEIVALALTSLATVSNCQVTLPTASANATPNVVGVVPGNLRDVTNNPLTLVPSGYYFWAVQKGITQVIDEGTSTAGDVITASAATPGKVASAAGSAPGLGVVLFGAGAAAGLIRVRFKAPLA